LGSFKKSSGSYFNLKKVFWLGLALGRARVSAPDKFREGKAK